MGNPSFARSIWITCILACGGKWLAAADVPVLKYALQAGQTYIYEVQIEARTVEVDESLSGESWYKVLKVDAKSGQVSLVHSASLQQKRTPQGKTVGPPPWLTGMIMDYNQRREVVLDSSGNILRQQTKSQLPYLLGSVPGLAIVPLEKGQPKWQVRRDIQITDAQIEYWLPRSREAAQEVARAARETIDYSIGETKGDVVNIDIQYAMATLEQLDGEPRLEQKGSGTIEFDSKLGLIRSLKEKLTLRSNDPGITKKVPVTVSVRLVDAQETARREKAREEQFKKMAEEGQRAGEAARKAAEEARKPKVIDNAGVDAAIANLKEGDRIKVSDGTRTLSEAAPLEPRRADVAKALTKLIEQGDQFVRMDAIKALGRWARADDVPTLVRLLEDDDVFTRLAAIEALGQSKDERSAEALAKQLPDLQMRMPASQALKELGAIAEKPVAAQLKHRSWEVRMEACEILAAIGTDKSVEPLKEAGNDRNQIVVMRAQEALREVEKRK